jgi:hypothetical protein
LKTYSENEIRQIWLTHCLITDDPLHFYNETHTEFDIIEFIHTYPTFHIPVPTPHKYIHPDGIDISFVPNWLGVFPPPGGNIGRRYRSKNDHIAMLCEYVLCRCRLELIPHLLSLPDWWYYIVTIAGDYPCEQLFRKMQHNYSHIKDETIPFSKSYSNY